MESSRQTRSASTRRKEKEKENPETPQEKGNYDIDRRTTLTNYATARLAEYEESPNLQDADMWETFQDDFGKWSSDDFHTCAQAKLESLKELLRRRGVYVDLAIPLKTALAGLRGEREHHTWTKEQIKEHIDKKYIFQSRVIYDFLRKPENRKNPPPPEPESQDPRRDPEYGNWRGRLPRAREGLAPDTSTNYENRNRGYETARENRGHDTTRENRGYETTHENRGYDTSYANRGYDNNNDWNESANGLNRALANLTKMYTDKLQYGGNNDNFDQN